MQKLAFIFPGQGSQAVGMAKDLAERFPIARQTFEEADEALGYKISDLCFNGPEEKLKLTEITPENAVQKPVPIKTVDFVSEDDVRRAINSGEKIYISKKTILTPSARQTIAIETDYALADVERLADVTYKYGDLAAAPSSGSFPVDAMLIVPCSVRTERMYERQARTLMPMMMMSTGRRSDAARSGCSPARRGSAFSFAKSGSGERASIISC